MGVRRRLVALLWRRGTMDEVGDAAIWIGIFFFWKQLMEDRKCWRIRLMEEDRWTLSDTRCYEDGML